MDNSVFPKTIQNNRKQKENDLFLISSSKFGCVQNISDNLKIF